MSAGEMEEVTQVARAPERTATFASARSEMRRDLVGRALGELVCELYGVAPSKIGEALDLQAQRGGRIGELLVQLKAISRDQMLEALAIQLELPYLADIDGDHIPDELIRQVPITFAKQNEFVPLGRTEDNVVIVATSDPLDVTTQDSLRALLGSELELAVSRPETIRDAINSAYDRATRQAESAVEALEGNEDELQLEDEVVDLLDMDGDDEAPIIRLVNSLMSQAVKDRASDIHIEPFERDMVVRFRVDGVLREIIKPPKRFQSSIVSRVKIMAGLNIAEKRLPQDGRIRLKVAGKDIDVRVSTVPTTYGERIVMRLLDRSSVLRDLDTIGFNPRNLSIMNALIEKSHGIILVTGPTGSGKTSTLYACLAKINRPDLNILTIEDPVEYQLKGVGQVQVNPKIELSFASGLRSFLRQDPDVIMVGEIRDRETAEIAIQASLTGHLVLSTVHTNDSAGAVTRLVDMGVEPFLVASSLIGVLAQRLVRTVCQECKERYTPSAKELSDLGIEPSRAKEGVWRGRGCQRCLMTGYQGRTGIYELMLIDDEIRQLILKNVDAGTIKNLARKKGLLSLREDGADKVLSGITTTAEVTRVTQEDAMSLEAF
ncbi:MAG: type II secretion system ATPase GspE [Myxococcota bacterium]